MTSFWILVNRIKFSIWILTLRKERIDNTSDSVLIGLQKKRFQINIFAELFKIGILN